MDSVPHYPPKNTPGIYCITHRATERVYVGSAVDIARRWYVHISDLRGGNHRNSHLQRAWDKYGADAFQFSVLEIVPPEQLAEREQYWIEQLQANTTRGYNCGKFVGAAMSGRKHTPESIAKMSRVQTGRQVSEETRARLSARIKGRTLTPEWRAKMSAARTGKKMPPRTDEWKQGQSKRCKGKPLSQAHREAIRDGLRHRHLREDSHLARTYIVTTPEGQEIEVHNISAFCREHQLSRPSMSKIARGITHTHKGWRCRYKP